MQVLAAGAAGPFEREFSARDYVIFLLHMDAQIEHALMVQYLYAAYSLGCDVAPEHADRVRKWREVILGVAKEEMGHLMTVQNVLRLVGGPLCLERDDYPWSTPFYPFPFALEPLTLDSLAKYVYAESPAGWSGEIAEEVKARVKQTVANPHRVGELFRTLIERVGSPDLLAESVFQAATVEFQADFGEWGRGYEQGRRGNASGANPPQTPDVVVRPVWSRGEAVIALRLIAEQGEAPSNDSAAPSHFARFLAIYMEMRDWKDVSFSLPVARNPYVPGVADALATTDDETGESCTPLTHRESVMWAQLHNLRYRMLLSLIEHSFQVRGTAASEKGALRGTLVNAAVGEMYNLRAVSTILMRLPAGEDGSAVRAGPPFQMPYVLHLPPDPANRWRAHLDVLDAAGELMRSLRPVTHARNLDYLLATLASDEQQRSMVVAILRGHGETP